MATLILASVAFSAGGAFMKPSGGFTRLGPSLAVVACFVLGAILLTRAVSNGNLSTTYVLGLGLEAVVSVGVGMLLLGERLTAMQTIGIACILVGLVVVRTG